MSIPDKAYGISPAGHNPRPSGVTGNGFSDTEIDEGEEQPLYFSPYRQCYVDWLTLKLDEDKQVDLYIQDKTAEDENFRAQVGFRKTIE